MDSGMTPCDTPVFAKGLFIQEDIMKTKIIYSLLILSFFIISCSADDLPSITADTLQSKLQSDTSLVLLDIRTEDEFNGPLGRLEGAILIPKGQLEERIAELEEYKDREIIVYCRSGIRSRAGTRLLLEHGYKAFNLLGGIKAWNKLQKK
jgi:rhodanese-related sulfurtransferase